MRYGLNTTLEPVTSFDLSIGGIDFVVPRLILPPVPPRGCGRGLYTPLLLSRRHDSVTMNLKHVNGKIRVINKGCCTRKNDPFNDTPRGRENVRA